jgi:O-antigen biosynthesis protein
VQTEELVEQVFSSPFVDEALCWEKLGAGKRSADAAGRYLQLPVDFRPDISHLLDRDYYSQKYPDVRSAEMDPLIHFVGWGCAEGRSPHPFVDPIHIRTIDPFLLPDGCDTQVLHDVLAYDLVNPSPYFQINYYRDQVPAGERTSNGFLVHFLVEGMALGLRPNPLFEPLWYSRQLDHSADPLVGLRHFVLRGDLEGRAPCPAFSGRRYLGRYADVSEAGLPALAHYLTVGQGEGRAYFPEQDEAAQLATLLKARRDASNGSMNASASILVYQSLKSRIAASRQNQKDNVRVAAPRMVHSENPSRDIHKLVLPRAEEPMVSILIPVFNEFSHTVECIAAIIRSKPKVSYEVVIADDASTDDSMLMLKNIKNLVIVRQQTNLGFLENCNTVFTSCSGTYLLLLNSDAQLMPGSLDAMADVLNTNPNVAVVGPKILYPDGRLQEAGCSLDSDGVSTLIGLFADPSQPAYDYDRDVHYCSGAALLIRRSDIDGALFDPIFKPAYCEDADLCLRMLSRGRRVVYCARAHVVHHLSVSLNKQSATKRLQLVVENQHKLAKKWSAFLGKINTTRIIAFYLPQFHTTPENDYHWGLGFTEWTNVSKALPGYVDHYQPHVPSDLGYYDLRVRQTIERQVALAQRYGIDGFCVYYYNFGNQRALEQAFEAIVADRTIAFQYCVCWANENWTRHWDGGDREIIFEQQYDRKSLLEVVHDAIRYAEDPRYIRVNGKPLFVVYRPLLIPDPQAFSALCRESFCNAGFDGVHLVYAQSMEVAAKSVMPANLGFDACVEFPPHGCGVKAKTEALIVRDEFIGTRYAYEDTVLGDISQALAGFKRYPCVFPSWDNTPRQPLRGDSFIDATPEAFQVYLEEKLEFVRQQFVGDERLLFVNAWNEWAEGTHLEPDQKFGHRWLEAVRNARMAKSLI